ncbi:MAG: patatin-like phospholipase family protein [Candidatus Kapaibacterium sp.]
MIKLNKIFLFIVVCMLLANMFNPLLAQEFSDSLVSRLELYKNPENRFDTSKFNIFLAKTTKKKVALVLSGGGARGLAQIGVIDVLNKYGVKFDMIVGTSVGAITGGLYSSGYSPDEIVNFTKSVDWKSKLALTNKYEREFLFVDQKKSQDKGFITISLDGFEPMLPNSLSSGQQLSDLINITFLNARFKPKKNFADLKVPFYAVATDLDKGKRVVLEDGNISESIKASFTYPLLYSPTQVNGRNLVDGGLTANIPVDVAKEKGADLTITVNSTSPLKSSEELKDPFNTADQILSITLAQLNDEQIQKSDIIITPDLGNMKTTDFDRINFVVDKGKYAAEKMINSILVKLDSLEEKASDNYNNFIFNGNVYLKSENIPDSLKNIIFLEQENTFVRYVTIEKRLRDIYKTGFFNNVYAKIYKSGLKTEIEYVSVNNPVLNKIIPTFDFNNFININSNLTADSSFFTSINNILNEYGDYNKGKIINRNEMYALYEKLTGTIRSLDYSFIDIDKFYLNIQTGSLEINFTDGVVRNIGINGNKKTSYNLILSETYIPSDKPVKGSNLLESLGGVVGTNLFQQVSMYFNYKNKPESPELVLNVVEKSTRNIRFSFRADNERKLQLYFDFRNLNLYDTGNEIGLIVQGGLRDRNYQFELKSYRFFGTIFTYNWSFYYRFRDIFDYTQTNTNDELIITNNGEYRDIRFGTGFLLGTQVKKFGTVFGQLVYEKLNREIIQGITPAENELTLFRLRIGGRVDTEDKYPFATKGTNFNYIYETSTNQLNDGITFTKLSLDITHNISLGKLSILRPKFVFGITDKTTPNYEFFSLGGEDSFYGMREDEMRGRQILLASLEYRYKLPIQLFFDTYLSIRYDLGKTWENTEDIRFKDLQHGLGFATQFDTPIGKASFSVGRMFIINKGFTSESLVLGPYSFYFSIGYNL